MSYITLGVFLVFLISSVASLRCYQCVRSPGEKCDTTVKCATVCGQYTLQYPEVSKIYQGCYVRDQCSIVENLYANNPAVTVKDCKICEENLCNNSGSTIKNTFVWTSLVLSLIMFKLLN